MHPFRFSISTRFRCAVQLAKAHIDSKPYSVGDTAYITDKRGFVREIKVGMRVNILHQDHNKATITIRELGLMQSCYLKQLSRFKPRS